MADLQEASEQISALYADEPAPAEAPEEEEAEQAEDSEEIEQEETDEGREDENLEDDAPEEDDQDAEEPIETLAELAEAMDTPVDELLKGLKHNFKSNGKEVSATLEELIRGHQQTDGLDAKAEKLSAIEKKADTEYQSILQERHKSAAVNQQIFNANQQLLLQEFSKPEIQALRTEDEARYLLVKDEFGQRLNQLNAVQQEAAQLYEQDMQKAYQRSYELITEKVDGFGEQHAKKIQTALDSLGLSSEEIRTLPDHRLLLGALELADLREEVAVLKAEKEEAKSKVKKSIKSTPKFTKQGKKSGVRKGKVGVIRGRFQKPEKQGGGSVADAAALIAQSYQGKN